MLGSEKISVERRGTRHKLIALRAAASEDLRDQRLAQRFRGAHRTRHRQHLPRLPLLRSKCLYGHLDPPENIWTLVARSNVQHPLKDPLQEGPFSLLWDDQFRRIRDQNTPLVDLIQS